MFLPNTRYFAYCSTCVWVNYISDWTDLSTESGRARSSWLGLGTEPPADRSPNRRRIVWMRCSTHGTLSSAVKPGLLGGGRSLTDRRTDGGDAWSPNSDVDRNSISIVSERITGGSRHTLTTQHYLDRTDNADIWWYSCDVIKTLRATEATCSTTSKAIAVAIICGHARVGRLHGTHHSWHLTKKPTETLLMYFLLCLWCHFCILDLWEF